MINLEEHIRQLSSNAEAMRELMQTVSVEQAAWKPNPETWSLKEVMEHIYNEERLDFRKHLKEMFSRPPQTWKQSSRDEFTSFESYRQALEGFLGERDASIAWLRGLEAPDWETASHATFGPGDAVITLKAGDVLVSWVEHDFLHLRQMIELGYAWNEKQALPYSVEYAGGW